MSPVRHCLFQSTGTLHNSYAPNPIPVMQLQAGTQLNVTHFQNANEGNEIFLPDVK